MSHTPIRAVSFDLWVTLIRSDPRFKPLRNESLRTAFAPHMTPADFDATLREWDKNADALSEASGADYGFEDRLALMFDHLGIDFDRNSQAMADAHTAQEKFTTQFHPLPYHPDVPALVAELATHVPVAVTSNTGMLPGVLMRRLLVLAGFIDVFSHMTFSNEVNVCKPEPAIFKHTFNGLAAIVPDLTPDQVLHVGDNPNADIKGGTGFGMQAALVNTGTDGSLPIEVLLARTIEQVSK